MTEKTYGATRRRGTDVSFEEIERAARALMADGKRPTVKSVRDKLERGSPNHITACMERFWKNQAALNSGDPIALTRLPPALADAAVAQWEQALQLSQQVARHDDNAARAQLQALRRDTEHRARSIELREKDWDTAARLRERALAEAREQVGVLVGELADARAALRGRDRRIAELDTQLEQMRQQLATVVARAVVRHRSPPRVPVGSPIVTNRGTVPSRTHRTRLKTRTRAIKRRPTLKKRLTGKRQQRKPGR